MSEKGRFLKTEELKIDQLTFEWFIKTNIPLSGPIVRKKSQRLKTFNENFKVSERWLQKFQFVMKDITFKCP
jgi:hypothetical protein